MSKKINLALQGGGAHGAFTWGVLDALLQDPEIAFEGISGTSAGAMNAVALVQGWCNGLDKGTDPREAARDCLKKFWSGVTNMQSTLNSAPAAQWWAKLATQWMSPYQSNPMDLNPLRSHLDALIDFDRLNAFKAIKCFVAATQVTSGKAEIFSGKRLTVEAVMASACLPTIFKAVEIEGEAYWDGGFSGNPAFHPLIYHCETADIVLVQLNPVVRESLPTTVDDIADRINEINFNASVISQMRAIAFVQRLLADGKLDPNHYKNVLMHRIDGGDDLEAYTAATKLKADATQTLALFTLGQDRAKQWLSKNRDDIGSKSSVNIARDYLDDMRMGPHT